MPIGEEGTEVKAEELIGFFKKALEEGWGYIWGQWGAVWTQAKQNQKVNYMALNYGSGWKSSAAAKEDNYYYSALYGAKWIGKPVADCSGLFRKAFDTFGLSISHSSNRIWEGYCTTKGKLLNGSRTDGLLLKPGTAVFVHPSGKNRTHIGLYVGNGLVVEASGTQAGVIKSSVTHKKWVEWGELKAVEYEGTPLPDVKPVLKKGDKGSFVTLAQTELIQKGYDCGIYGADGKFGVMTEAAVKRFQTDNRIDVTGVINQETWDALDKQTPVSLLYTVSVPHLTKYKAEALVQQYAGASMIEERW